MTTFKGLVDQVELALQGFVYDQAEQTYLTAPIDNDDLTLSVDEPKSISRGIVQIDDEIVWVKRVDNSVSIGNVSISPFGRGYLDTPGVSHAVGARVMDNPIFPRSQIKLTINRIIRNLYPDLYVLKPFTFNYIASRVTYELPADCVGVSSVKWSTIGPSKAWLDMARWQFNPRADPVKFPNGKSIDVWSLVVPGQPIKVDCINTPATLVNDSDDFSTVTGLGDYVEQAIIYGVCYQMAGWLDTPRLQTRAVETSQRSSYVETGAAVDVSKYFYALYKEALSNARARFLQDNPTTVHFQRY